MSPDERQMWMTMTIADIKAAESKRMYVNLPFIDHCLKVVFGTTTTIHILDLNICAITRIDSRYRQQADDKKEELRQLVG